MELEISLKKYFGYSSFRNGQKEVIESILKGKHTSAMLPTGTGKSLCYQLPGYIMDGSVLIVSPLLSLMQDQVDQMKLFGEKRVIALNSFLTYSERRYAFEHLKEFKFIFISPEMLALDYVTEKLKQLKLALFVVDEAHCISQWGYDFRPDYSKLGDIRSNLGNPLTLALTATATKEVRQDILRSLRIDDAHQIVSTVDRRNIALYVEKLDNHREKLERLFECVSTLKRPGIVYFSSKKMAMQAAEMFKDRGITKADYYHGGMDQEQRILVQQQFLHGQLDVVCATSAFGMGINKDNVRFIIHFHMPLQLESYLQEIGRAGRDGAESIAILLHAVGDEQLPLQLAEGELPSESQLDWLGVWFKDKNVPVIKLHDFEDEVRATCGLTEIQWRFICDFLLNRSKVYMPIPIMIEELKKVVESRLTLKKQNIFTVKEWLENHACRRQFILEYFEETMDTHPEKCCDLCGINLNDYYGQCVIEEDDQENEVVDWDSYLKKILLNK
ncbi:MULTISPECIES: ATP-dependent DNA helicase RecQ [unclassified Bacillus (in: firmicutes)]|uniref:RecQ family ATP-dependent DNA helicase n=1 Tax=unclassified Bacillus (in: firmicutes) TaxID=185979 RepID=UPI0008DFDED9|nr:MULTISPECIES: ATP-dependent DNA helicase RecQ [unclassified Bacillus (in: firmicutes)]SFA98117.1 ATP-dependent DNA helicase RecQ [Bacillus sp. UNCCL13]SFQ80832.1 ATP-dependent DNA helicase RecQ [Bacillus sp. cl95]